MELKGGDSVDLGSGRVHNYGEDGQERYPYCIVWTPLPLITWICPIIGHMGICDSRGVIRDFQGPYTIGNGTMAFGKPTRYLRLDPEKVTAEIGSDSDSPPVSKARIFDSAVEKGCKIYSRRMHNLCFDNCHSHVAVCLEDMRYHGITHWNMVMLAFWVFFRAPFVSFGRFVATFLPFCIILTIVLLCIHL